MRIGADSRGGGGASGRIVSTASPPTTDDAPPFDAATPFATAVIPVVIPFTNAPSVAVVVTLFKKASLVDVASTPVRNAFSAFVVVRPVRNMPVTPDTPVRKEASGLPSATSVTNCVGVYQARPFDM